MRVPWDCRRASNEIVSEIMSKIMNEITSRAMNQVMSQGGSSDGRIRLEGNAVGANDSSDRHHQAKAELREAYRAAPAPSPFFELWAAVTADTQWQMYKPT